MQDQQYVPSLEELEQALTQISLQRAALKDQIEALEKQQAQLAAVVQHLRAAAQKEAAEAASKEEVTVD